MSPDHTNINHLAIQTIITSKLFVLLKQSIDIMDNGLKPMDTSIPQSVNGTDFANGTDVVNGTGSGSQCCCREGVAGPTGCSKAGCRLDPLHYFKTLGRAIYVEVNLDAIVHNIKLLVNSCQNKDIGRWKC